jgi:hypothetical protein
MKFESLQVRNSKGRREYIYRLFEHQTHVSNHLVMLSRTWFSDAYEARTNPPIPVGTIAAKFNLFLAVVTR